MSTWWEDARAAARDFTLQRQEADEREAASTVEYVQRFAETLGLRAAAGTARLGERTEVDGDQVRFWLRGDESARAALVATVSRSSKPPVHLHVTHLDGELRDHGVVETLVDVGLALDGPVMVNAEPEGDATVGDMLQQVLEALVRDVVHDVLDGRLGDGQP